MNASKREVLLGGVAASLAALGLGSSASATEFAPGGAQWRNYEVKTTLRFPASDQPIQAWVALQSVDNNVWARPLGEHWTAVGAHKRVATVNGARLLHVSWPANAGATSVEVTSRFASRDRTMPSPARVRSLSASDRQKYLAGTHYIPTDGRVRDLVTPIVAGIDGDLQRARAIYEWMIANTYRDGAVRGCGTGDVNALLDKGAGHLGGKCADLNGLFVAMLRSADIPARDIYGVRVGPSRFGYHALGPSTPIVTRGQHCRAEAFIEGHGWVAMDPADVRKVMLEEVQGGLPLEDERVVAVHAGLFGASEGNWLPYNTAHDVALPGSPGEALPFLMYAQAEVGGVRSDCLNPDSLNCVIEAHEIV